ncbi:NAD(P)/FAD-dependent oxidoreductase [Tomitella gaofuii]|uniref:NAD(P)/FAD-dependent oxidoreductase n=1 Tax=Tomitella gaofuii TaxID=2760083 RepID=UPI002E2A5BEB|nr:FAD-dependent oxidoreductase [Tomitella gaofuii]
MRGTAVVVGASLAGARTAQFLRAGGFDGRIVLIGDEPERPYMRIALSKDYLAGRYQRRALDVHEAGWYERNGIELHTGTRAHALDPVAHRVSTDTGERFDYDTCLLATGLSTRRLDVPGATSADVHYVRTAAESRRLHMRLSPGARVAVIGAGWLGLEVAAAARTLGCEVTVVARSGPPLARTLGESMARMYLAEHRAAGVDVRTGAAVSAVVADGDRVTGVRLDDGAVVAADVVVAAVGGVPNSALAVHAGLDVAADGGVLVDEHLRTSDPDVYAAGDVASAFHPGYGEHLRLEHWANALNQPAVAARSMLGEGARYERLPYFFSDQWGLGMEFSGRVRPGAETVLRGDADERRFIAFWVRDGVVEAGMNVNVWDSTVAIQQLIRSGRRVDTARLVDERVPLSQL